MADRSRPGHGDEELEVALSRYQPRSLPAAAWRVGRADVLAAVRATQPPTRDMGLALCSELCRFLAACSTWDRTNSSELCALLTEDAIERFVSGDAARTLTEATRRIYRASLRRVGRAIGSIPKRHKRKKTAAPKVAARFFSAMKEEGPFTALVAVYERCGHRFHALSLSGQASDADDLLSLLADGRPVTAPGEDFATLRRAMTAAASLRDAPESGAGDSADSVVGSAQKDGPGSRRRTSRPPDNRANRPMSRTAALKAAKAAYADEQRRKTEGPKIAELPALDDELAEAVAAWRPKPLPEAEWEKVADAARALVTAYRPPSCKWISSQAGHVARFCRWVVQLPERPDPRAPLAVTELTDPGLINRYVEGPLSGAPDASRATARAVLRRAVHNLSGDQPLRLAYTPVQPPYSARECVSFVALARHQPTASRRRSLGAIVALGLGCGLDPREQAAVSPRRVVALDLGDGERALAVEVLGPRARLVPVRAPYDELLGEVLSIHEGQRRGPDRPLYGDTPDRTNVTSGPLSQAVTATGSGVDISAARLRSTWLVACMSAPVPLSALLYAAGLRSARTLCDLLAYCPDPRRDDVARILRAAEARGLGSTAPGSPQGAVEGG